MLEIGPLDAFYGDSHVVQAVRLSLAQGEGVAILGRNGAGKTTLMKAVMAGGPRVAGPLMHRGVSLAPLADFERARRGLGFVPEDRRIYPHLTVFENIAMGRHATRPGITPYTVEDIYRFFPLLRDLSERLGFELSGGQQQLLAIARAVLARPDCLLLDEPTEGLAPVLVEALARELNGIRRSEGMALMLTEQNIWFARQCTERLYIIDSGCIVFEGAWTDFDAHPDITTRYLAL